MVARKGYKLTEVGEIPEDWEVRTLANLGFFLKGRGITREEANSGDIPSIRYGEIYTCHNDTIKKFNSYISDGVSKNATLLRYGDILFACSGETKEDIGKSVAYTQTLTAYAGGDIIILRSPKADSHFLGYALNSHAVAKQKAGKGQGDTVVHISSKSLGNIEILLPSTTKEQTAIATALSDDDALIDALEQCIAKKRHIKQGAMQELLTGKRRLPGFEVENQRYKLTEFGEIPYDWEVARLGELFDFFGGFSASRAQLSNDGYPYLHYGDIHATSKTFIDVCLDDSIPKLNIALEKISTTAFLKNGDMVFVDASEDDEGASRHIVVRNIESRPFIAGLHTLIAREKNQVIDNIFKEFCFQTTAVKLQFRFYAVGTKVKGVNKKSIAQIKLIYPPTLNEQAAIAAVLTAMDDEIAALEAKLSKARQIKAGMMQELLTGRTRLV